MKSEVYQIELERDSGDGTWTASWYEKRGGGVIVEGKTIDAALRRFRGALAVHLDNPKAAKAAAIQHHIVGLPRPLLVRLEAAKEAKAEADSAQERAGLVIRKTVADLTKRGLSARDVGTLIGVSRQRAHKLLKTG